MQAFALKQILVEEGPRKCAWVRGCRGCWNIGNYPRREREAGNVVLRAAGRLRAHALHRVVGRSQVDEVRHARVLGDGQQVRRAGRELDAARRQGRAQRRNHLRRGASGSRARRAEASGLAGGRGMRGGTSTWHAASDVQSEATLHRVRNTRLPGLSRLEEVSSNDES